MVGSSLAAQEFTATKYFHERPSATSPAYNAGATTFANLGPTNPQLAKNVDAAIAAILELEGPYNPGLTKGDIPVDAVTTSASGIDPHISPAYAQLQAHRIAAVRNLPLATVQNLISENTDGRSLGFFGEPGVNVLEAQPRPRQGDRSVMARQSSSIFSRELTLAAIKDSFPKLDPRLQFKNPVMFIVEIGSVITTGIFILELVRGHHGQPLVRRRDRVLALAHRAVRELRRGDRRGTRQGTGGDAARDPHHDARAAPGRPRAARRRAAARRRRDRRGRRGDPRRRRRDRGRRLGRRVGDHRRVRARDPRVRRRPLGRHRRHQAALRPARDRGHPGAGAVVPRPHDRARRGRRAAQDAERDRAQHPARGPDDHLPRRGRDAQARSRSTRAPRPRRPC